MARVPTNVPAGQELDHAKRKLSESKAALDKLLDAWDKDDNQGEATKALSALWQSVSALIIYVDNLER